MGCVIVAKQKDYFSFRCGYKPEVILDRLREQVKLLKDREYLLKETESGFDLGIGRGGHQGGYWYCAAVVEDGDGSHISGRVVYRTWHGKEIKETWIDKIEFAFLFVILLPMILAMWIYRIFRPEITDEERFVEFMTTKMDCELLK